MAALHLSDVLKAQSESPWDLTNEVLYNLCRKHPGHCERPAVLAKILLIGRSHAAAIERRKNKTVANEDFYLLSVAPEIMKSGIDRWIARAKTVKLSDSRAFDEMVDVHAKTTELFQRISGLEKRSLASKYLHFHVPQLFFIFDSRSVHGLRNLGDIVGRAKKSDGSGDNEYRKFVEKCLGLRRQCWQRFNLRLSPRQIDNLLLAQ
jgi:hypothetical protein